MKFDRFFKVFVCLVLVCAILFMCSPFRANAIAGAAVAFTALGATAVVGSLLAALGVLPPVANLDFKDFDSVVQGCISHLTAHGFVSNGQIMVKNYRDEAGVHSTFLPYEMVECASQYISDPKNNVLVPEVAIPAPLLAGHEDELQYWKNHASGWEKYLTVAVVGSEFFYIESVVPVCYDHDSSGKLILRAPGYSLVYPAVPDDHGGHPYWIIPENVKFIAMQDSFCTNGNLALGNTGRVNQDFKERYADWLANAKVTHPGDETPHDPSPDDDKDPAASKWLGVGIAAGVAGIAGGSSPIQTQEQIQSGEVVDEDAVPQPDLEVPPAPDPGSDPDPASKSLADYILNGIRSIFVPSEDYLSNKLNALILRFPFIDSIVKSVKAIEGALFPDTSDPPVIWVETQNATGKWDWGKRTPILDMSFYKSYKPKVDSILSGCLWAFFIWKIFMKLPGIIGGEAGDVQFIATADDPLRSGKKKRGH